MTRSYEITYDLKDVDTSEFPGMGDTMQEVLQANNEPQAMHLAKIRFPFPIRGIRDITDEWLSKMSTPLVALC